MLRALALCAIAVSAAFSNTVDVDGSILKEHSFMVPLKFAQTPQWRPTLSTSSRHDFLILSPLLPNKAGHLWNTKPLRTDNFQIDFEFSIATQDVTAANTGMALIIADEIPSAYDLGTDFVGSNGRFNGAAIVFSNSDSKGRSSAASLTVNYLEHQTSQGALQWPPAADKQITMGKFAFKSGNKMEVRVTVKENEVLVHMRNASVVNGKPDKFQKILSIKPKSFVKGGKKFIGFSASSGRSDQPTSVSLYRVETNNLSKTLFQEAPTGGNKNKPAPATQQHSNTFDDEADVTNTESLSHSEKMNHLSRIVYKFVSESATRESSLDKSLATLQDSVKRLNDDISVVNDQFRNVTGATNKDILSTLKHDISNSIKTMVQSSSESHKKSKSKLESLKADLAMSKSEEEAKRWEMKQLQDSAERIVGEVEIVGSNASLFVFLFVLVFFGAVFALVRKERQLEKKHIL